MKWLLLVMGLLGSQTLLSSASQAVGIGIKTGPPSVGQGGSNPANIPPEGIDLALSLATRSGFEANASITGLLFGHRNRFPWGGYVSLGGGLTIDGNGSGPAVYSAFGMETMCSRLCFTMEYQQALGVGGNMILAPFALRIGGVWWTN